MTAPLLRIDFVPASRRGGPAGLALAVAGILGLGAVGWQLHALGSERAGLEWRRYAALTRRGAVTRVQAGGQDAMRTVTVLVTPWSRLLAELEQAGHDSQDSVALLAIEPDHAKHRIRITAEARSLSAALGYVERLRRTQVLHYPMLDSHELRTEDQQHPVRFEMSADWMDVT